MTFLMWAAHELKNIHDIVAARSKKYNGEGDEFLQIRAASDETGIPLETGVRFMMNMKMSRLNYGEDAPEDSKRDCARDLIGYSLMYLRGLSTGAFGRETADDTPVISESPKASEAFGDRWKSYLFGKGANE